MSSVADSIYGRKNGDILVNKMFQTSNTVESLLLLFIGDENMRIIKLDTWPAKNGGEGSMDFLGSNP